MQQRYLFIANVTNASGTQTFYVDAESQEEANRLIETGGEMYSNEVEVTDLSDFEPAGVTTLDDYGDFPPDDPRLDTEDGKSACR